MTDTAYRKRQPLASTTRRYGPSPRPDAHHSWDLQQHSESFYIPASAEEHNRIRIEAQLGREIEGQGYEDDRTITTEHTMDSIDDMFAQDSMDPGVARGIPTESYHSKRHGLSLGRTPSVISSSVLNSPQLRSAPITSRMPPRRAALAKQIVRAPSVSSASSSSQSESEMDDGNGQTIGQSTGNHRAFAATPVSKATPRHRLSNRPALPNAWQSRMNISPSHGERGPVRPSVITPSRHTPRSQITPRQQSSKHRGGVSRESQQQSDDARVEGALADTDGAVQQRNTSRSTSATSGYAAGSQPSSARTVVGGGPAVSKGSIKKPQSVYESEWDPIHQRSLLLPSGQRIGAGAARQAHLPDISGVTSALASPAKHFGVQHVPYSSEVGQSSSIERANDLENVLAYMNNVRDDLEVQDQQIAELKAGQGYWASVVTDMGEQVKKLASAPAAEALVGGRRPQVTVEDVDEGEESDHQAQREAPVSMVPQGGSSQVDNPFQPLSGCHTEIQRLKVELARQTSRLKEMRIAAQTEEQAPLKQHPSGARSHYRDEDADECTRAELELVRDDVAAIKRELEALKRTVHRRASNGQGGDHKQHRGRRSDEEDVSELDLADADPATPRARSPFKRRMRSHTRLGQNDAGQAPPTAPIPSSARFEGTADVLRHSIGCMRSGPASDCGSPFVRQHGARNMVDTEMGRHRVRVEQHAQTSPVRPSATLAPRGTSLQRQRSYDDASVNGSPHNSTPPQTVHGRVATRHEAEKAADDDDDADETAGLALDAVERAERTFMLVDHARRERTSSDKSEEGMARCSKVCTLPSHDPARCSVCVSARKRSKRRAARKERVLRAEKERAADGVEEEALLRLLEDGNNANYGSSLLPRDLDASQAHTLRRLLAEHTDEFVHLRITYGELADELKGLDPGMSKMRRRILAEQVLEAVEALELKAERVCRLREVLRDAGVDEVRERGKRKNSPPVMGHHEV